MCCILDTDDSQFFIVLDRTILFEVKSSTFCYAVFVLICIHFAFNVAYKESQKSLYVFMEEFGLGVNPPKKTKRYRKIVNQLFQKN